VATNSGVNTDPTWAARLRASVGLTELSLYRDVRREGHIDRSCVGPTSHTTSEPEWERGTQRAETTANQVQIQSRNIVRHQHRYRPTPDNEARS
jgi:hypothetical protein